MAQGNMYNTDSTTGNHQVQNHQVQIDKFWQTGRFDNFIGLKETRIEYAAFENEENDRCIILVPGRIEGYLKYKETIYDLFQQKFNVVVIDHRGQGISERLTPNKHQGYVEHFDDYVTDLHSLINLVSAGTCKNNLYLLAHSMGGAISALYLQQYPKTFTAAVLSSPMIAINSGALPQFIANAIVNTGLFFNQIISDTPWYFIGQNDYKSNDFANNNLTHSESRYAIFEQLYKENKDIQLGGVTYKWLAEAIDANKQIMGNVNKITTPTLVIQAGADTIVDNISQNTFCQQLFDSNAKSCPTGKPLVIDHAKHELFFEIDEYRQPTIDATVEWFNKY